MENDFEKIVERVLIVDDAETGKQREIRIQIGRPYWTEPEIEAACPVAIEGYFGRLADIHGIDPLNALKLAINFVDTVLKGLPKTQKVFWPNGESYFD